MVNQQDASQPNDPAYRAAAVVPSDSTDLGDGGQSPTRGLYIGVAGDVAVIMALPKGGTNAVTFPSLPVGFAPLRVTKVMATNTASGSNRTGIVALY